MTGDFLSTLNFKLSTILQQRQQRQTNGAAADCSHSSAGSAPFQRQPPSLPPPQNVNSAAMRELPASQFGGSIAKYAIFAAFSAFREIWEGFCTLPRSSSGLNRSVVGLQTADAEWFVPHRMDALHRRHRPRECRDDRYAVSNRRATNE